MTTPEPADQQRAAAFRRLFDAELQYVWNTLRYLGVRQPDVKDIAHEVFLTVYQRLSDHDPSRPVRPWLFVISYHAAGNYRRLARHRREILGEDEEVGDASVTAQEQMEQCERRRLLLAALERVDLDKRAVLVMHDMDGIAIPQVAEALGIPLNTAYSRLRLAREELRAVVDHLLRGGEA
jgi:RNA polymerase sigma-70 factor (ECF subfamily)